MSRPDSLIRTRPRPACPLCGTTGRVLHSDVNDAVWGVAGAWDIRRCPDRACGMLWIDPMPLEEDIGLAYRRYQTHAAAPVAASGWVRSVFSRAQRAYLARTWGYPSSDLDVTARCLSSCLTWLPQQRARLEASVFYLYGDPLGKLLDVGCGSGDGIVRLRALGWDAEGVDFDARAVETARGRGLTVAQGTLAAQRYTGATFAAIVMNHVMEHVHDPRAEFDECFRLLEPGGRLVVVTPNARSWLHRTFGRNWRGLEPPRHIQVFTRAALGQLATARGFQIQHLATTPKQAAFFFAASRSVAVARRRGTPSEDRLGVWAHRFGACMAALELALLQVAPDFGEELALVARKPLTS